MRRGPNGSLRMSAPIAAPNTTLVSRNAVTCAMGARRIAAAGDHRAEQTAPAVMHDMRDEAVPFHIDAVNDQRDRFEEEIPCDIGRRVAGGAHAHAIGEHITHDEQTGDYREQDRAPFGPTHIAALNRKHEDADGDEAEPDRPQQIRHFAGEWNGDDRDQRRRDAARDRIDPAHCAVAISEEQENVIADMGDDRDANPGPGCRIGQADKRDRQHREEAGAADDQGEIDDAVAPALDHCVPCRVHDRRGKNQKQDGNGHGSDQMEAASRAATRTVAGNQAFAAAGV